MSYTHIWDPGLDDKGVPRKRPKYNIGDVLYCVNTQSLCGPVLEIIPRMIRYEEGGSYAYAVRDTPNGWFDEEQLKTSKAAAITAVLKHWAEQQVKLNKLIAEYTKYLENVDALEVAHV